MCKEVGIFVRGRFAVDAGSIASALASRHIIIIREHFMQPELSISIRECRTSDEIFMAGFLTKNRVGSICGISCIMGFVHEGGIIPICGVRIREWGIVYEGLVDNCWFVAV